jgi:transcription initiation factor TFIID subunit 2
MASARQAIHALSNIRSAIVASTLAKTALVTNYFYRIRVEAILGLVAVNR